MRILIKLAWVGLIFLGITLISFWVIHLAPGSPTDLETSLNPLVTPEARERLEALYGLDQPIYVQYGKWLSRLCTLDLGQSLSGDHRPVWDKIVERLPLTFSMNLASLVLTLFIAVPIGIASAYWQGSLFDKSMTIFVFLGFAMPGFWLALLLMQTFGVWWPVLPISGVSSMEHESLSWFARQLDYARHLAMPLFVYTFQAFSF